MKKSGGKRKRHPAQPKFRQPNQHGDGNKKVLDFPNAGAIGIDPAIKFGKTPKCPKHLKGHAADFYAAHAKRMFDDGRLNMETRELFEVLCSSYNLYRLTEEALGNAFTSKTQGAALKAQKGFNDASKAFVKISSMFAQKVTVAGQQSEYGDYD